MSDRVEGLPTVEAGPTPGKTPLKPWQYIILIFGIVAAMGVIYFMFRGAQLQHQAKQIEGEKVDNARPVGFRGAPAEPTEAQLRANEPPKDKPMPQGTKDELTPDQRALQSNAMMGNPAWYTNKTEHQTNTSEDPSLARHSAEEEPLAASLHTSKLATAHGYVVRDPLHRIPIGTLIPCVQISRIDTSSGLPSQVVAEIPVDVWGPGHKVLLIDKHSVVVGEIGHGMVQGLDRLAVVWKQIQGPNDAYEIDLDSPAAGPLGEGGLDVDVKRHEWQKLKGVVALSLINGGLNIATALASRSSGGNGISFYQFENSGQQAANTLLQSTITIPDTATRNQGSACMISVARPLDFSGVWKEEVQ